jgi:hypothetical protein
VVVKFFSRQIVTSKNFSELVMQLLCGMQIYSVVTRILREVSQMPPIFSIAKTPSTFGNLVFDYSTSIVQDKFNQLSLFDIDSSFWVCDNSTTGHICKDKVLFTGDLVPSIYEIRSATGILNPTVMGTVTLRLMNDEGEKHLFILRNVNFLLDSPVNLLSLR